MPTRRPGRHAIEATQNDALKFRLAGLTYDEIATRLEYKNRGSAWKAVEAALKRQTTEDVGVLRDLELGRLERVQRGIFTRALGGDDKAIASLLKLMDHRAKLTGLYSVQAETNHDEVRAALAGFLAGAQATVPDRLPEE